MTQIRTVLLAAMLIVSGALVAGSAGVAAQSSGDTIAQTEDGELNVTAEAERLREEAQRLQDELFDTVVAEINLQAEERVGISNVANNVSTPEEAREEAERLMNSPLHDASPDNIEEAAAGLNESAMRAEQIEANLTAAADALVNASDPRAEAERIDAEVIADINAGLEQANEERFILSDGVELMEPILEDSGNGDADPGDGDDNGDSTDDNGTENGGNESEDGGQDSMGSPLVTLTGVIAIALSLVILVRRQ